MSRSFTSTLCSFSSGWLSLSASFFLTGLVAFLWVGGSLTAATAVLVTQNIEFRVVDDQDPQVAGIVSLISPENDTITFQDKVAIKGINRWLTPVILNGRSIPVRQDGRFSAVVPVPPGNQVLYLGFIAPDAKSTVVIKRQLTRLVRAKASSKDPTLVDLFYGFDLIPNAAKRDPNSFVTRGDLAVFFDRLSILSPTESSGVHIAGTVDIDSRSPLVGPITRTVRDGLFDLYADGSFRAEAPVSRLDYTVALVRRLGLSVDEPGSRNETRWFTKFNRAAVKAGLMTTAETTTVSVGISVDELANWSARIPDIRRVYQALGFADADPDGQLFRQAVVGMVGVKRDKGLISSGDATIQYADMSGHWLAQTLGKLALAGRFSPDMVSAAHHKDLKFGPKLPLTRQMMARWMVGVYQIPEGRPEEPVSDLPTETNESAPIATLVAAGIMKPDKRGRVFPDRPISRVELVAMLLRVNGLVPTAPIGSIESRFKDVPKSSWAVPYLNLAIETGLVTAGGNFNPNRSITRAEAMAMIAKTPVIQSVLKGVSND